jgi:redox-sensitive bicupin YhaK (pirin superfamily)
MTVTIRRSEERGHADLGWLDSRHTFSFADYHDPAYMGWRTLRVINDDVVQPGGGFGMHGHRDMEIVTYVVQGALAHQDTSGGRGVLRRGDVQHMTAGSGLQHSETNPSPDEAVRLLQIWLLPEQGGLEPTYQQAYFSDATKRNRLVTVAARGGLRGSLPLAQDAVVEAALLDDGVSVEHPLAPGRGAWVQVVEGNVAVNGVELDGGDGAAIEGAERVAVTAHGPAEVLVFDLA